jgi:hypothetical protein
MIKSRTDVFSFWAVSTKKKALDRAGGVDHVT